MGIIQQKGLQEEGAFISSANARRGSTIMGLSAHEGRSALRNALDNEKSEKGKTEFTKRDRADTFSFGDSKPC